MNRFAIAQVCLMASAAAFAGEKASGGYGGKLSVDSLGVVMAPKLADSNWRSLSASGGYAPDGGGRYQFSIKDGGSEIVSGRAKFSLADGAVKAEWTFDVKRDFSGNSFHLDISAPCSRHAGGEFIVDGKHHALPAELQSNNMLGGYSADAFEVKLPGGSWWKVGLDGKRWFGVQDNRKWNGNDFSFRVALGEKTLKAGERRSVSLTLSASGGIADLHAGLVKVTAGPDWIPVKDSTDIVPGSAIDFSSLGWLDAPAGKYGRVVSKGPHFEFEKRPGVAQRFYGVNLCFSANFPDGKEAGELAARLARTGYNALRIHHYEQMLTEGSNDGTRINPARMAQLDDLAAACIEKGIYLTTDLYVSRNPSWRAIGIDRDGRCSDYKDLCLFHEGAYANLCEFSRQFLCHVNPRTGRRWADEPAVAWIALINEGNPGNYGFGPYKKYPEAQAKWKAWLAEKKKSEPSAYAGVDENAIPDNAYESSKQVRAFVMFLADLEREFDAKFLKFLREEIGCKALYSNLSCWYNPMEYQLVRRAYDYVDDHFYVDHPHFLESSWRLPSQCPNTNPARGESAGFQGVVNHRLLDRPFTITEFNFSGPGRWRGVGGIMLGAQAALQDYDGIWRFAWSHDSHGLLEPRPLAYFDTARDPLTRATERAALCLYLRRDMKQLSRVSPIVIADGKPDDSLSRGAIGGFKKLWYGWYSRLGTVVGAEPPKGAFASFSYPGIYSLKDADLKAKTAALKPGDGQVSIDRERGVFGVASDCTCGFSCEGGKAAAGALEADISLAPAAVWVSSLDGRPVKSSRRLLLSHVTDVQDESITYADRDKKILVKWGRLPHLMQRGRAAVALRTAAKSAGDVKVYALAADGSRRGEVPCEVSGGRLSFAADTARDPAEATFMYEIVVR